METEEGKLPFETKEGKLPLGTKRKQNEIAENLSTRQLLRISNTWRNSYKASYCWEPRRQVTVGRNIFGAANPLF